MCSSPNLHPLLLVSILLPHGDKFLLNSSQDSSRNVRGNEPNSS